MGLPGISKEDMIMIDKIMEEELLIPIELMVEHAGVALARFLIRHFSDNDFLVIAGSGNNGSGGMVASRRLTSWGYNVEIFVPKGISSLKETPLKELTRAKNTGAKVYEGLPNFNEKTFNQIIIDTYLGYGFEPRNDKITELIFEFYRNSSVVISLDSPSGFDFNSGKDYGNFVPKALLTIAFVKKGLFLLPEILKENLYVIDIGVPKFVFEKKLRIDWNSKNNNLTELNKLYEKFSKNGYVKAILKTDLKRDGVSTWRTD